MEAQLAEVLQFLHDRNAQARQVALANLVGYTPKGSPHRELFTGRGSRGLLNSSDSASGVINDLKLLCRDHPATAHDAFRALVNLSDSTSVLQALSDALFLDFLVSYIINPSSVLADLATMLLSNITANPSTSSSLISLKIPIIPVPDTTPPYYAPNSRSGTSVAPASFRNGTEKKMAALPLLVDAFVDGAVVQEREEGTDKRRKADLHFLASVFANISTIPAGRSFFLTPIPVDSLSTESAMEYPLSKLTAFTEHKDTIRRGGVASTIKNCAFQAAAHRALLSAEDVDVVVPPSTISAPGINILPAILLPLAGPEEFEIDEQDLLHPSIQFLPSDKKREVDPVLRLTHIETLLLLCTTRWGRDQLRAAGVYQVVKVMHLSETDEMVAEHIERLVTLLHGDESASLEEEIPDSAPHPSTADEDDDNITEV